MSASALKRIWPILIVPEVREWVIERIERGTLQRIEVGVNSPVRNLSRKGPPIPDDGLSVNIVASGVTVRPVDEMPSVRDADLKARVTGRTATVDDRAGRRRHAGRPQDQHFGFHLRGAGHGAEAVALEGQVQGRLSGAGGGRDSRLRPHQRVSSGTLIDPNNSKGTMSATITLAMPVKGALTKADTTYTVTADLGGFAADKLVMNQKLEANTLKIVANNAGYQVKGDVKINGQPASLDYRKAERGRRRRQIAGDAR